MCIQPIPNILILHIFLFLKIYFILLLFLKLIYFFVCFWLCWVFIAAHGLSLVAANRGSSSLQCVGFSLWWLIFFVEPGLQAQASVTVARGLSSCGALHIRGTWDLPGPGIEPTFFALAGGFLTTVPPGKSLFSIYFLTQKDYYLYYDFVI